MADGVQIENHAAPARPDLGPAPLCVDLDGTLIATDSLWEALLLLARNHPLDLLRMPFWLAGGGAAFKEKFSTRVAVDAMLLPYRPEVLDFIKAEKQAGRELVLATASHQSIAQNVAAHLGLFDHVIGSTTGANLEGEEKRDALERRFGAGNFDYIGDSRADLPVWKAARRAYVVSQGDAMRHAAEAVCKPAGVFHVGVGWRPFVKALRPHQWVKNLLLFIPLILAHQINQPAKVAAVVCAFWSFSFCASAIYIINDLLDLESDRRHPTKCRRPFASGKLSAPVGILMSVGMLAVAFGLTPLLPWQFSAALAVYLALTTAYSFWLKRKLLVDVIVLAGLYTHRIIAGAMAVAHLPLTMWLLAFSMFFFLSLAFAKRYSELIQVEESGEEHVRGRGYQVRDLRIIESIGPSSGYLAVLVFCNYLESAEMKQLYPHPHVLWLVAPILLYWITRIWFIARRRSLHDDPIIFAIRDRRSYICGILAAAIVLLATIHWPSISHH